MVVAPRPVDELSGVETSERRGWTRIRQPFRTDIDGRDPEGRAFHTTAVLDNISASGLFIRLGNPVEEGAELSFVIRLSTLPEEHGVVPRIAARGTVRRVEPQPDGKVGIGVIFTEQRFI